MATIVRQRHVPWAGAKSKVPEGFETQCRLVWKDIEIVLCEGGMNLHDLVKVTTCLSSCEHRAANSRIRAQVLGAHPPALTNIICEIYSPE